MAVTQQLLLQPQSLGEVFIAARDLAGPASYQTGGYTLSAKMFALQSFKVVWAAGLSYASGTYYARTLQAPGPGYPTITVKWYVTSTNAEVGANTDLSASKIRFVAIGN